MKSVPRSIEEPARFTDVNVLGTQNVLLAARDARATVVYASSSSVYGDQERFPLTEDLLAHPRSPYAATKLAGEHYCRAWWESFGVPTVALRYFNVYGPGQDPASEYAAVVPEFVVACLTGERPTIHGDGEQGRDFTFIDDVVEANLLAARAPDEARGLAFNIGGGAEPTSVNRLLELIAAVVRRGARPHLRTRPRRDISAGARPTSGSRVDLSATSPASVSRTVFSGRSTGSATAWCRSRARPRRRPPTRARPAPARAQRASPG